MFTTFPYPNYEQWRNTAEKTLKGESFEDKLVTETYEGISLQPMYWQEEAERLPHISAKPGTGSFVRGATTLGYLCKSWEVAQELRYGSPADINEAARFDLNRGLHTVNMALDQVGIAGENPNEMNQERVGIGGTSISSLADIGAAFQDVDIETTPVFIQAGVLGLPILSMMVAHMQKQGKDPNKLSGCIGTDPISVLAQHGSLPISVDKAFETLGISTKWAKDHSPHLQTICVRGEVYHDGGASAVEELAFTLAAGVEALKGLGDQGIAVEDITRGMRFSFSIGSHLFMEIAKLRAARYLWANIVKAFGGSESSRKMYIHGRTSSWTKTRYDPYMNVLRSTTEAFAGIMGGVNSLHVSAFDEAIGQSDGFSRRIARNTHMILKEEAHLDKVVDPAGGSWYLETLTDALAQKAWSLFQEVESKGGMLCSLQEGFPQARIAGIASKKITDIGHHKAKIVGTNFHPDHEELPLTLDFDAIQAFQQKRIREFSEQCTSVDAKQRQKSIDHWRETFTSSPQRAIDAAAQAVSCGATLGDLAQIIRSTDVGGRLLHIMPIQAHRAAEIVEEMREQPKEGALV